jgi:hypothetical protein
MISCPGRAKREPGPRGRDTRDCDGPRLSSAPLRAALRPGHESSYAACFTSPKASASSEYDFFRASWSYTAVITISSSGLLASISG